MDEGNRLFLERNYTAALAEYEKIITSPIYIQDADRALFMAGECYRLQGNWEMAKRAYWKLVTEHKESDFADNAYLEMAQQAIQIGENHLPEAIVLYESIISRFDNSEVEPEARLGLARARIRMHFFDGAEDALRRLITRHKSSPILGDAYFELGQLLANPLNPAADRDLAIESYRMVVDRYPLSKHLVNAYFALGNLNWEKEQHEKAIRYFRQVVTRAPDTFLAPLAQTSVGLCYQDLNNYPAAIQSYQFLLKKFAQPKSVKENIRKLIKQLEMKNSDRLNVSAWVADVDQTTRIGNYSGDVLISLGKTRITSDRAEVDISHGQFTAENHVRLKWGDELTITAESLMCRISQKICILTGNAILRRKTGDGIHEEKWHRIEISMEDGSFQGRKDK